MTTDHRDTDAFRGATFRRVDLSGASLREVDLSGTTIRDSDVTGLRIVRWDRFAIPSDHSGRRLALTTCYPFGAQVHGPWRYVVYADAELRS